MEAKFQKRTFYNRTLLKWWFPHRLEKGEKISKDDLETAFAQMALYDLKDGGTGSWKRIKKDCLKVKIEARIYNRTPLHTCLIVSRD